jgi:hypothetical protein
MKTLTLIPLLVAAALGAVAVLCRLGGVSVHGKEAILAGVISAMAGEAALVPSFVLRRSDATQYAQAALGGTVLHLILTILMAVVVIGAGTGAAKEPFVYWLIAAYWTTLAALVWAMVSMMPVKANGKVPQCD